VGWDATEVRQRQVTHRPRTKSLFGAVFRHAVSVSADGQLAVESVTLRPAIEADLPGLVELTTAFYQEDGFTTAHEALAERFITLLDLSEANLTVAVTSKAIIGFALTTMRLILESGLVAELQDLYVRPEHRGKGVGSALVSDAARWARTNGADLLEVVIAPNGRDVSHLHRYYESRGFVDEGRRIVYRDV
jgi:GNAT superfamily N-acetyltransferase